MDFERAREAMVARQIAGRGIDDPAILAAFRAIPRERFVPPGRIAEAYDDAPVAIEAGQTVSQPYIVALMIALAGIGPQSRVLEVGAGSGYAAAILGRIAREVVAIERHAELARLAGARIGALGLANVAIVQGDGWAGWRAGAPYNAIIVSAAAARVPEALVAQLAAGGRLVIPVGAPDGEQRLLRLRRGEGGDGGGEGEVAREDLGPVRFVPLVGG